MKNRRDYYRILKVQPDAPAEIIQASYRTMMGKLRMHPDLGGSVEEAALLNEAYETLRDPVRRASYDEELFLEYTQQPNPAAVQSPAYDFCPICRSPLPASAKEGICPICRTPLRTDKEQMHGRSLTRTRSSEPIQFYMSWPGEPEEGRMIDFSPRGLRFICGRRIAPQTVLKISSRLFEASGTVTNLSEEVSDGQPCYAVGVCFRAVRFTDPRGTFFSTSA